MGDEREVTDLEELLDRIGAAAGEEERITLDSVLDEVGRRTFGPWLLVAGLVIMTPVIGDIPGVPTLMSVTVLLVAVQMLFRGEHVWLPQWLLNRSVERDKLCKGLKWARRPARFVDRLIRPRLGFVTGRIGHFAMVLVCVIIAAATPAMEFVPFSANGAGAALTAFGLSLVAHDGLLALLAFAITLGTFGLILYSLL